MTRGGGRDFSKIVHYYEPYIDGKRHKVGVKMSTRSITKLAIAIAVAVKGENPNLEPIHQVKDMEGRMWDGQLNEEGKLWYRIHEGKTKEKNYD